MILLSKTLKKWGYKIMFLYHFTDKKINCIDPKFFGKNYYTKNDQNVSNVKRSFFYDKNKAQEFLLQGALYCYKIKIDKNKIYDLTKDKKNILKKCNYDIDKTLKTIKKMYIGAYYNNGFNCYILFNKIKLLKIGE
jgi:hypothetical protein